MEAEISVFKRPWELLLTVEQSCAFAPCFQKLEAIKILKHVFHDRLVVEAGTHLDDRGVNYIVCEERQSIKFFILSPENSPRSIVHLLLPWRRWVINFLEDIIHMIKHLLVEHREAHLLRLQELLCLSTLHIEMLGTICLGVFVVKLTFHKHFLDEVEDFPVDSSPLDCPPKLEFGRAE